MSLKVTYIGHATVLIEWDGLHILTDPVFSNRILFFKRSHPLAYDPAQLPKLDAILLSHAHYDHLDLFSYKYIPSDVPIIIPEGMSKAIKGIVNNPIVELSTWSRFRLGKECEICAVPARHRGGRLLIPYRYRTCHGYVIRHQGENIYFAGDSAYGDHLARIGSLFPIKLAFLPYGLTKAWEDLGRPHVIPIHWGTFFGFWNPPQRQQDPSLQEKLHLLAPGETFTKKSCQ